MRNWKSAILFVIGLIITLGTAVGSTVEVMPWLTEDQEMGITSVGIMLIVISVCMFEIKTQNK